MGFRKGIEGQEFWQCSLIDKFQQANTSMLLDISLDFSYKEVLGIAIHVLIHVTDEILRKLTF